MKIFEEIESEVRSYARAFPRLFDKAQGELIYDDDGNEVTKQRSQAIEIISTGSEEVTKSKIRMDLITGSLGEYAYARLKTHMGEIFGSDNVKDL